MFVLFCGFSKAARSAPFVAAALLLGGVFSAAAHPAFAQVKDSGKMDAALARVLKTVSPSSKGWTNVIVQIAPGANAKMAEKAVADLNGDVFRHLEIIQSFAVRIPTKNLQKLADLECVAHLSADVQTYKTDDFTVKHSGADTAMTSPLFGGYGLYGTGVTVAVLDSGIRNAKDFNSYVGKGSRLTTSVNFVPSTDKKGKVTTEANNTDDQLGHGTHVAGIIAGNGTSSTGLQYFHTYLGVAPNANLVNVRVLDDQGGGSVSNVLAGINWIVQNKAKYNIRVLNVSLGHPVYESYKTDPLNKAVEAAWKAGIVVVCSAGNTGRIGDDSAAYSGDNEGYGTAYGTIQCPGNDPLVITVGAMKNMDGNRAHDKVATYSSRGPSRIDMVVKPDIMAPGNRVISVCADNSTLDNAFGNSNDIKMYEYQIGGKNEYSKQYFELSGTSMAAPVVSGAAALLLDKDSSLSPDTIKARLMLSADKWTQPAGTADILTYGAGFLNIVSAINNTVTVPQSAASYSPVLKADADGNVMVWADQAFWGKASLMTTDVSALQAFWGKASFSDTSGVWANQAFWGKVSATQAFWGKVSAVQANQAFWGKASVSAVDVSAASVYGE